MRYIIDGHNLIPKLGLRLDSFDDELELVRLLQEYGRLSRNHLEVYFDNAPQGQPKTHKYGTLTAHFVQKPQIADEAIRVRLKKMGSEARNWIVVSSDHRVQVESKALRAKNISSDDFAGEVRKVLQAGDVSAKGDRALSENEVDEWMKLFKKQG